MRWIVIPGESMGTRIIDCCWYVGAEGLDCPMKIQILQRGSPAPEVHHLRPLMMYSSPRRSTRARMFVASEEATSGSVIAKQERISPDNNGASHLFCCSAVP